MKKSLNLNEAFHRLANEAKNLYIENEKLKEQNALRQMHREVFGMLLRTDWDKKYRFEDNEDGISG